MSAANTYLVVFASLNQVALVKRSLYRRGVYVEMMRTPHSLAFTGCSFALRCDEGELAAVRECCIKTGCEPRGVFEESVELGGTNYRKIECGGANA